MRVVKKEFTNSACRPVTGWVRTTGCSALRIDAARDHSLV